MCRTADASHACVTYASAIGRADPPPNGRPTFCYGPRCFSHRLWRGLRFDALLRPNALSALLADGLAYDTPEISIPLWGVLAPSGWPDADFHANVNFAFTEF
jgi:hypothetical protein